MQNQFNLDESKTRWKKMIEKMGEMKVKWWIQPGNG